MASNPESRKSRSVSPSGHHSNTEQASSSNVNNNDSNNDNQKDNTVLSEPTDFTANFSMYMHPDFDVPAWRVKRKERKSKEKEEAQAVRDYWAKKDAAGEAREAHHAPTTAAEEPVDTIMSRMTGQETQQNLPEADVTGPFEAEYSQNYDADLSFGRFDPDITADSISEHHSDCENSRVLLDIDVDLTQQSQPSFETLFRRELLEKEERLNAQAETNYTRATVRSNSVTSNRSQSSIGSQQGTVRRSNKNPSDNESTQKSRERQGRVGRRGLRPATPTVTIQLPDFEWPTGLNDESNHATEMLPMTQSVLDQIRDLNIQIAQYKGINSDLRVEIDGLRNSVMMLEAKNEALERRSIDKLDAKDQEIKQKDQAISQKDQEIAALRDEVQRLHANKSKDLEDLQKETTSVRHDNAKITKQYQKLKVDMQGKQAALKSSQETASKYKELYEANWAKHSQKLKEKVAEIELLSNKTVKLQMEIDSTRHEERASAKKKFVELKKLYDGVKDRYEISKMEQDEVLEATLSANKELEHKLKRYKVFIEKVKAERNRMGHALMLKWGEEECGRMMAEDGRMGVGFRFMYANRDHDDDEEEED